MLTRENQALALTTAARTGVWEDKPAAPSSARQNFSFTSDMGRGKSHGFQNKTADFRASSCTDQLYVHLCSLSFPTCKMGMVLPTTRED